MSRKLGLGSRILSGLFVTFVFVFLYAPILIVVVFSFQGPPRLGPPLEDIGLHWYRNMFDNTVYMDAFGNTIVLAAISMVIALVLGTMTALGLRRAHGKLGTLGNILFFMPLATPSLFVGLALLAYFDTVGIPLSHGTVAVAHLSVGLSLLSDRCKIRSGSPRSAVRGGGRRPRTHSPWSVQSHRAAAFVPHPRRRGGVGVRSLDGRIRAHAVHHRSRQHDTDRALGAVQKGK